MISYYQKAAFFFLVIHVEMIIASQSHTSPSDVMGLPRQVGVDQPEQSSPSIRSPVGVAESQCDYHPTMIPLAEIDSIAVTGFYYGIDNGKYIVSVANESVVTDIAVLIVEGALTISFGNIEGKNHGFPFIISISENILMQRTIQVTLETVLNSSTNFIMIRNACARDSPGFNLSFVFQHFEEKWVCDSSESYITRSSNQTQLYYNCTSFSNLRRIISRLHWTANMLLGYLFISICLIVLISLRNNRNKRTACVLSKTPSQPTHESPPPPPPTHLRHVQREKPKPDVFPGVSVRSGEIALPLVMTDKWETDCDVPVYCISVNSADVNKASYEEQSPSAIESDNSAADNNETARLLKDKEIDV